MIVPTNAVIAKNKKAFVYIPSFSFTLKIFVLIIFELSRIPDSEIPKAFEIYIVKLNKPIPVPISFWLSVEIAPVNNGEYENAYPTVIKVKAIMT